MATSKTLTELPNMTDECGCSLMGGRCASHAAMMKEIHAVVFGGSSFTYNAEGQLVSSHAPANEEMLDLLWSIQDGYGIAGFVPDQGFDWSGIRDSSTAAVEAMHAAIHA